jgi:hypothetical protein
MNVKAICLIKFRKTTIVGHLLCLVDSLLYKEYVVVALRDFGP